MDIAQHARKATSPSLVAAHATQCRPKRNRCVLPMRANAHTCLRKPPAALHQMPHPRVRRACRALRFCRRFAPPVNESPSKDAFFVLFHGLPIGGAQQLPYISRCRLGRQTQHHQRIRNVYLMAKTAAKKAAPKKAVKKVAATKTAKPAKAATSAAPKPIKEALSKTGLVAHIAESTQLAPKDVRAVLASLEAAAHSSLNKKGVGSFTLPGMLKITSVNVPAKPKRKGINPFTKEEQIFAAKAATRKVKVRPLKKLKDAAL
ncbi:nucleoid DNA-binding protein [Xanthomonas arboricola]|uniref:Nucleoid DNA-binding protein n=2 Tax=Xanthomonas TaxID=338 RepID=A0ABR6JH15_9XANT|nr:nucleoid DNA-binding protein [Xanthomonas cannabis]MBB5521927.1 nucleoid DNA-binding protein [Xanthomonas cannabis]